MAEGLLGGLLQDDGDESHATAAADAAVGAEAFAAAVAARLSGNDPGVARMTEAFLDKQSKLLKIQATHLVDEHALRLDHLVHESHLLRGQRLGQSFRIGFQVFSALPGALHSRSTVIWPAPNPNSKMRTSADRTGPIRSKPGAISSLDKAMAKKPSRSMTRRSNTHPTGPRSKGLASRPRS